MDFNEFAYFADTGRRWNGNNLSVRDKVSSQQKRWGERGLVFHSTQDIINALRENRLPSKIMMTFHPQRWTNNPIPWTKELLSQNLKNIIKGFIVTRSKN